MQRIIALIHIWCCLLLASPSILACTRVLWANDHAVIVGRTMDWRGDMHTNLWIYPRGMAREGLAEKNSMHWVSKYGSIVATAHDVLTTDGMNEKGLAAHLLWLNETDYGTRNDRLPGMSVLMVAQYYLDNFSSVEEAVRFVTSTRFQIEPFALETPLNLHFLLEDSTGDSAIIEYINGEPHIYHDRSHVVVTNSPTYDIQLEQMHLYQGLGGILPLPGSTASPDRFVRASYYLGRLPQPTSDRSAITEILSVTNNTAIPYAMASADHPIPSETIWETALDLTHRVYYFISTSQHNLLWANLNQFNLNVSAPTLKLDLVNHPDLSGDVTSLFLPCNTATNFNKELLSKGFLA